MTKQKFVNGEAIHASVLQLIMNHEQEPIKILE